MDCEFIKPTVHFSCDFVSKKRLCNEILHQMEELEEKYTKHYALPIPEVYVDVFDELSRWLEAKIKESEE